MNLRPISVDNLLPLSIIPDFASIIHDYGLPSIALFGGIATSYLFFRNSTSSISRDVITSYKERVEQLQRDIDDTKRENERSRNKLTDDIAKLTAQVNQLSGMIREKDDRIKTLEDLLTNRNPELQQYMKDGKEIFGIVKEYIMQTKILIEEIHHSIEMINVSLIENKVHVQTIKESLSPVPVSSG